MYSAAMAQYVMGEKHKSAHRVIDFVDVDSDKWRQFAADSAWPRSWIYQRENRKLLEFERKIAAAFNPDSPDRSEFDRPATLKLA